MPLQSLPRAAETHSRRQRVEIAAAVRAIRRVWRRMGPDFDASFAALLPSMLAVTDTAQERITEGAAAYVPAVIAQTDQDRYAEPAGAVRTDSLVGVDGSGRPVDTLLHEAVIHAKTAVGNGVTSAAALASAGTWLSTATGTLLSDTGRAAETVQMGNHKVGGYVRMLAPPSCSRCAILAGRWYADSTAFQRHPGCDCRHVPASESVGGDLRVDPQDYFDSLTEAEQDQIFTKAGAEAIRNGADIGQVVNARRGMSRAQSGRIARNADYFGQYTTTAGRTSSRGARLMPESIRDIATSKDDYIRLLKVHGYIR